MSYTKEQLSLVSTGSLPSEVSEVIRAAAIEQFKRLSKFRQYGYVDSSPDEGDSVYIFNTVDELSAASKVSEGAEPLYEDANATKGSEQIWKLMKAFKLTWEADHLKKINLRAAQTRAAVDQVFDYEDNLIITKLITDITAGGNTTASPSDWSANTADPVKDLRTAKRTISDDGYTGDLLILNPTNNEELDSVIASNTWYSITEQTLRTGDNIPFMGLQRIESTHATLGTFTVITKGISGTFITGEAKPLTTNMFDDNDAQVTKVQIFERVCPCATIRPQSGYTGVGI